MTLSCPDLPFDTLLIANRGEIACRIIRTARRLGLRTVAVVSEADRGSLAAELADTAVLIGPAPAADSYLRADRILEAARRTGSQAIHPGYGFLSENAGFAEACAAAGLVFVGPPPAAIRAMGSKSEAKRLMAAAGVPLVPGYHGEDQSDRALAEAAAALGFPVLVKAAAGGGGKGMRVVRAAADLEPALAGARREAKAAFGDDTLLIEKYLDRPRHVEVQVFADGAGTVLHLFERDCSVQRRHQKVIEEAPAPFLDADIRTRLHAAAVAAARAVGYVGAGTVEFLVQDGAVCFIEMNTRLQVEHPVTECITGLDLVEWQLRVAGGQRLPLGQDQVTCTGHAFEARLYAEDPARDFLPAVGRLHHLRLPPPDLARVDAGVRAGDAITVHYDPMIAKLIVAGPDRTAALRRLSAALAATQVAGVVTNLAFLGALAGHPAFAAGAIDTGFIERHRADLIPAPAPAPGSVLALAALALLLRRTAEARAAAAGSADPHSPWRLVTGWRLNSDAHQDFRFLEGEAARLVVVHFRRDGWEIDLEDGTRLAAQQASLDPDGGLTAVLDGIRRRATVAGPDRDLTLFADGRAWRLQLDDPAARVAEQESGGGRLTSPMPGTVVRVLAEAGQPVRRGAPLLVVEAMKMEHTIAAPADGVVEAVLCAAGDQVSETQDLVAFRPGAAEAAGEATPSG